jgi:hypothetical protein
MCPLRYILLLLSLLVAMIGFTQAMKEPEQLTYKSAATEEDEDDEEARVEKSTMRTLVDMLNGRYLYDAWKASQGIKTA